MVNPTKNTSSSESQRMMSRKREILVNQPKSDVTTQSELMTRIINNYANNSTNLGDTIESISKTAFELSGSRSELSETQESVEKFLEAEISSFEHNLQNTNFSINKDIKNESIRRSFHQDTSAKGVLAFNKVIEDWKGIIKGKESASCDDLEKINHIVNAVNTKGNTTKQQDLKIAMLLYLMSNSKATMTNSINKILTMLESYINENVEKSSLDPKRCALFLMVTSEYISLASKGIISVSSLSQSTMLKLTRFFHKNSNSITRNANSYEGLESGLEGIANLVKCAMALQVRAKSGLAVGAKIRNLIGSMFTTLIQEASNIPNLKSEVSGIIGVGAVSTSSSSVMAQEKCKTLKIANDRIEKLGVGLHNTLSSISKEIERKIGRLHSEIDIKIKGRQVTTDLKNDLYLVEGRYDSLSKNLVTTTSGMLSRNETSTLATNLMIMADLRNKISEEDGRSGKSHSQYYKVRDIYGISDLNLKNVKSQIIRRLKNNNLSAQQNSELVSCLSSIITIGYAKERNKTTASFFIQNNRMANEILSELLGNIHLMNENARFAIREITDMIFEQLSRIENSDMRTNKSSFVLSSPTLFKLMIRNQALDLEFKVKQNDVESIKNIQTVLFGNIAAYCSEFVYTQGIVASLSNLKSFLNSTKLNFDEVKNDPVRIATTISVLRGVLIAITARNLALSAPKQRMIEWCGNEILRLLKVMDKAIINPSSSATHRSTESTNALKHIYGTIGGLTRDNVASPDYRCPSSSALLYLGSILLSDEQKAMEHKQEFLGSEHQDTDVCTSEEDLIKFVKMLLHKTEEFYDR